jgi:hypothetical protein
LRQAFICAAKREPYALTVGETKEETEKRISSALIEGGPAILFDNMNNMSFRSAVLESAITENPSKVRPLGYSKLVLLSGSTFIILNGNGLSVSTDTARRLLTIYFDPGVEDGESRKFEIEDFLSEITKQRADVLVDVLTIWRWGRQNTVEHGKPLGFPEWERWCRDPLIALGCRDPVDQILTGKKRDAARLNVAELFEVWWNKHGERHVKLKELDPEVIGIVDPKGHGYSALSRSLWEHASPTSCWLITCRTGSGREQLTHWRERSKLQLDLPPLIRGSYSLWI